MFDGAKRCAILITERETASGYPPNNELLTFTQGQPSLLAVVAAIFFCPCRSYSKDRQGQQ